MSGHDPVVRRTDGGDDREGTDDRGGGWLSRLFPSRDERIRSLRRQLREAEREKGDLADEVERLEGRIEELEREKEELDAETEAYRRRQFAFEGLLTSVGQSFDRANDALGESNVVVGDLDVTLRADVSGGGAQDRLDLRLVDPDEEIDADRLSTVSFSVSRRGRFRHYGRSGARTPTGGRGLMATAPTGPPGEGAETTEADEEGTQPSGPPVEVPNVIGLPVAKAEEELRDEGFGVHRDGADDGTVVEQWPRGLAVAPKGSSVVIIVDKETES